MGDTEAVLLQREKLQVANKSVGCQSQNADGCNLQGNTVKMGQTAGTPLQSHRAASHCLTASEMANHHVHPNYSHTDLTLLHPSHRLHTIFTYFYNFTLLFVWRPANLLFGHLFVTFL